MPGGRNAKLSGRRKFSRKFRSSDSITGEQRCNLRGEVTVAQPSGSFPGRAIGEQIDSVLPVGLLSRRKQPVQPFIARCEVRPLDVRVGVLSQVNTFHITLTLQDDQFQIPQRIGLKRLHPVSSGRDFIKHNVDASETFEVHVAIGEDFIEGEEQASPPASRDFRSQEIP